MVGGTVRENFSILENYFAHYLKYFDLQASGRQYKISLITLAQRSL